MVSFPSRSSIFVFRLLKIFLAEVYTSYVVYVDVPASRLFFEISRYAGSSCVWMDFLLELVLAVSFCSFKLMGSSCSILFHFLAYLMFFLISCDTFYKLVKNSFIKGEKNQFFVKKILKFFISESKFFQLSKTVYEKGKRIFANSKICGRNSCGSEKSNFVRTCYKL